MIIPAILEKNSEEIQRKIALLKDEAHFFHIDVADGKFVPNTTFLEGEKMKEIIDNVHQVGEGGHIGNFKNIDFEAHLMVQNPHNHYKRWIDGGSKVIIFHIESFFNIKWKLREFAVNNFCNLVKQENAEPVIALNPETKIDLIEPYLMKKIFRVHFLSVNPGFQGNRFIPEVLKKIRKLKIKFPNVKISADGGINENTIKDLKEAKVEIFGIGSGIFAAKDPIEKFKQLNLIVNT